MARKRRVGRPKGSSAGPRLKRGKLSSSRAKSYLNRGLAAALKKRGAGSKVGRRRKAGSGRPGRKAGFKHSAATIKKIAAGVRAAHRAGKYKSRKRKSTRRRKAA